MAAHQAPPIPGILQARILEWASICFSNAQKWKVKVKSLSRVWLLATPGTEAYQAPPSMGFFRQKSTGVGCHCLLPEMVYKASKVSEITKCYKNESKMPFVYHPQSCLFPQYRLITVSSKTCQWPTQILHIHPFYHHGIWLWRSAGFNYRTSTGLGKQRLLEGTNKTLCTPGPRGKEQWPNKRLSQTCLCVLESLGGVGQQRPATG